MLVDKQLIIDAKEKIGAKVALTIAKDLELKEFDEINLKSLCPFHDEDTPSFIWNQHLNNFHCFGCQKNYDIIEHYMSFYKITFLDAAQKLFEETDTEYAFGEKGVQKYKNYKYPFYDKNDNRKDVEDYLKIRRISKETLDYCDVQQDNNHNIVFNFCDSNDVLTLVKYRPAKKIEHGETKSWCQPESSTKPILFNMNRIDVTKPLLINEGEIDCLASIESGYTNSVSIPLGAGNTGWIEENFEWLEQFDKIIIWSDNDVSGMKMRKEVCSRLGMWRTFYVDLPQTLKNEDGKDIRVKDTNEVLFFFGKGKVIDLIENAQDFPIDGVINLARVEPFDLEAAPGLYTGLKNVDNIIYKFLFGSVLMVTGRTGSGKSALISQLFICEPLNQGHDVFIYSGELGKDLVQSWLELSMAGPEKIKMRDRDIHVVDGRAIEEMHNWYDERVWLYEKNSNSSEDILERAVASIRKYGVKVILLDNLMSIDIDADSQSLNQKQKEFLNKLNQLALLYNVLVVLVAHPKKFQSGTDLSIDDISGASEMPNTAQYVMAVKRYWKKDKDGIKKQNGRGYVVQPTEYDGEITIKKNRYTGRVGKVDLFFDYPSYRFYNTPKELWKRYKWNKDKSPLPTHDPNKHSIMPEEME